MDNRKRSRSDDEDEDMIGDELPPHMQQQQQEQEAELPPHLQHQGQDQDQERAQIRLPQQPRALESRLPHQPRDFKRGRREVQLPYELEKANELMRNLQRLGDNPYDLDKEFMNNGGMMAYFWTENDFKRNILKFLGSSMVEFPHKALQFAVVILIANARNPKVGGDFIQWVKARIEEVYESQDDRMDQGEDEEEAEMLNVHGWNRVKLLLRCLMLLLPIVEDKDSLFDYLEKLLQLAIDTQIGNDRREPMAEMLIYQLSISLPYILANDRQNEEFKMKCKSLVTLAKSFTIKTSAEDFDNAPLNWGLKPFAEILQSAPDVIESSLDDLSLFQDFSRIIEDGTKMMLEQKAEEDLISSGNATADAVPEIGEIIKHQLGSIKLPESLNIELKSIVDKLWSKPRFIVEVFKNETVRSGLGFETLPPLDTYVSMITRDLIEDLVLNVEYNRVVVSRQLLSLQSYFNSRLFCLSHSSLEKLMIVNDLNKNADDSNDLLANLEGNMDLPEDVKQSMIESARNIIRDYDEGFKSTWKIDELFLEVVINLMFTIPSIDLPMVYFESLLMDTSGRDWANAKKEYERDPLTFSKLLGDCFRSLYGNLDNLKHEIKVKFVEWFVYQISNYKFEWQWEEWVPDVLHIGLDNKWNKQIWFIKNAIHKEMLLTNGKLIKRTLPEDLKPLANLAINEREQLIDYDAQFFGQDFAQMNTQDPFEHSGGAGATNGIDDGNNNDMLDYDRIVETNTDAFKLFGQYFFNHHEHKYNEICRDVYMNLENSGATLDEFLKIIERLRGAIADDPVISNADQYIITLVIQSVCLIGSRSFSVLQDGLRSLFGEKVNAMLAEIDNQSKSEWVCKAVLRLWTNEPRIGMLCLSRLIGYGVEHVDIIHAAWQYIDATGCVPVQEVWMEQFLDRFVIDEQDQEIKSKLIETHFAYAQQQLEQAKDESEEKFKAIEEFIECKKATLVL